MGKKSSNKSDYGSDAGEDDSLDSNSMNAPRPTILHTICACACCIICTPLLALCCCCSLGNTAVQKVQGKRWDGKQHKWVVDNLAKDEATIRDCPANDEDILKMDEEDADASMDKKDSTAVVDVKETEYYDALSVSPDANEKQIKRAYYINARKFHPDKNDSEEAEAKFQVIGEAYQVLSDPKLRAAYDKDGKDGLSGDKTGLSPDNVDPGLVFTFLFGSDAFYDIIGRLQLVTQTMAGDSEENRIDQKKMQELERRRVVRLAIKLRERIQGYVDGQEETAKAAWDEEASMLVECRYGEQILNTVGAIYRLVAIQYEGTLREGFEAKVKEAGITQEAVGKVQKGAQELQGGGEDGVGEDKLPTYIELMWNVTVIDITATIRETAAKVILDKSVKKDVHKKRVEAIRILGDIFEQKKSTKQNSHNRASLYQSAAAAAMEQTLEKMRKEEEDAPLHTLD